MNRALKLLALILVGLVVVIVFTVTRQRQAASVPVQLETKTNSEAAVTVEVTPLVLRPGKPPKFKVSFTTHSVDLNFEVPEIASLADDQGRIVGSPQWSGAPPGGHHRSGELDFGESLDQKAKSVILTLKNIAGVPDRSFTWEIL